LVATVLARRNGLAPSETRGAREVAFDEARGVLCGTRLAVYASLAQCESLWRRAAESCAGYAFQSFEWQSTCQATIGAARGVKPHIAVLSGADGRVLFLLPLGIYRYRGLRVLRFLGDVVTDYGAPLIDTDFAAAIKPAETARLWSEVCRLLPRVDVVWLWRMPPEIEGVPNPMAALPGAEHTDSAFAAVLPASMAEFRKTHRVNWSDTRRRRRRLAEHGRVEFELATTEAARREALDRLARDKSRRWRETGARDLFAEPGYLEFYRAMTDTSVAGGKPQIAVLRLDGRVVAAHWGLVVGERFYYLLPAYDAAWQDYSVGRLLLENMVEWAIRDPAVRVFDLTAGGEAYKHQWTDCSMPLYELLAPASLPGRVYVGARRLRQRLKRHPALRNLVRRLRGKGPA
jgi:CelD/BcsL family acetyltransferase involved in cellulose biosynthesis